jgi:putative flippase GtrA
LKRIFALRHHHRFRQLLRYSMVSVIATSTSLIVFGTLVATNAMPATWANVVGVGVGTVPSFELNRRWVWGKSGRRSIWAEVGPFVTIAFAGLAASTIAVGIVDHWARRHGLSTASRTLAVLVANVTAFGSLWVLQFVILDRVLFKGGSHGSKTLADDANALDRAAVDSSDVRTG